MSQNTSTPHQFHIPVLGTGFSVDTPIKVARYGIDSVMSVVDDELLEQVRRHHSMNAGIDFVPIRKADEDHRAKRTRAYLDLVGELVARGFAAARDSFPDGPEARKYFELLPDCPERADFQNMSAMPEGAEKAALADKLKAFMRPGRADINIMTKLDRIPENASGENPAYYSDASASLRGFAESSLESAVVFSAGMNPRLFDYLATFESFRPDASGRCRKQICVKVSDYRSAFVQGLQLAKKGLWTSEFRVESGLNCGGHAFPTKGTLLGPILEEFVERREELREKLYAAFSSAAAAKGFPVPDPAVLALKISAQGGVGTAAEHAFLKTRYALSGVGWGSPFLLVPEATNVDDDSLRALVEAREEDLVLSDASPLGVPFWSVRTCAAERERECRIAAGKFGTNCPKGYLAFNQEFGGKPRCTASTGYQLLKLKQLKDEEEQAPSEAERYKLTKVKERMLAKVCLCRDLASSFTRKAGIDPQGTTMLTAGPNLAYFKSVCSLSQMAAHIYGRTDLLAGTARPHVFVAEARLYVGNLAKELADAAAELSDKGKKYFTDYYANLVEGFDYYERLSAAFLEEERSRFLAAVAEVKKEAQALLGSIEALPDAL